MEMGFDNILQIQMQLVDVILLLISLLMKPVMMEILLMEMDVVLFVQKKASMFVLRTQLHLSLPVFVMRIMVGLYLALHVLRNVLKEVIGLKEIFIMNVIELLTQILFQMDVL